LTEKPARLRVAGFFVDREFALGCSRSLRPTAYGLWWLAWETLDS